MIQMLILKLRISLVIGLLLFILGSNLEAQRRDYFFSIDTFLYVHRVLVEAGKSRPYSGLLEEYYPNRSIRFRITLDHGVPTGKYTEWDPDSTLRCVMNFDNQGREQGEIRVWNKSGSIDMIGHFKDGLKDSTWLFFWSDSVLFKEAYYKEGLKQGTFNYYTDEGKLYGIEKYRNDTLLEDIDYFRYMPDEDLYEDDE